MAKQQTLEPSTFNRSTDLIRDYNRARFMRRAMLSFFSFIFVLTLLYAIPWLPGGLSVSDYNDHMTVLMLLVLSASVSAFGAVYLRETSNRVEQTLMTWNTVHEGLGDMRKREYFFDRIVAECQRAKASGGEFTVINLRLHEKSEPRDPNKINIGLNALAPLIKESDCLASLGPHEIGVLAPKVNGQGAALFAESLRGLLATDEALSGVEVYAGWAVYRADNDDAGALVGIARERMLRQLPARIAAEIEKSPEATAQVA